MIGREKQRGKPLEWFCKFATVFKYEFGENDKRCFCHGLIDIENDEVFEECIKCGAYAINAKPPKEADNDK